MPTRRPRPPGRGRRPACASLLRPDARLTARHHEPLLGEGRAYRRHRLAGPASGHPRARSSPRLSQAHLAQVDLKAHPSRWVGELIRSRSANPPPAARRAGGRPRFGSVVEKARWGQNWRPPARRWCRPSLPREVGTLAEIRSAPAGDDPHERPRVHACFCPGKAGVRTSAPGARADRPLRASGSSRARRSRGRRSETRSRGVVGRGASRSVDGLEMWPCAWAVRGGDLSVVDVVVESAGALDCSNGHDGGTRAGRASRAEC